MVKTSLVGLEIETGAKIVQAFDRSKVKLSVALWAFLEEYEDWRIVLASRQFDTLRLRDAYGLLHEVIDPAGFDVYNTPPVVILPMKDPFIKDLRGPVREYKNIEGLRLGPQVMGDRFLEDSYIYRVT